MSNTSTDPSLRKRRRMTNVLSTLGDLPGVTVTFSNDYRVITIVSRYRHVPDFTFRYADDYGYYRGYIYIVNADTDFVKSNAGYAVCTLKNSLVAAVFTTVYQFFNRNRAFRAA